MIISKFLSFVSTESNFSLFLLVKKFTIERRKIAIKIVR